MKLVRVLLAVAALALLPRSDAAAAPVAHDVFTDAGAGAISCFFDPSAGPFAEGCLILTETGTGEFDLVVLRADGRSGRALLPASEVEVTTSSITVRDLPTFGESTAVVTFAWGGPAMSEVGAIWPSVAWEWVSQGGHIGTGRLVLDSDEGRFVDSGNTFYFTGDTSGAWISPKSA